MAPVSKKTSANARFEKNRGIHKMFLHQQTTVVPALKKPILAIIKQVTSLHISKAYRIWSTLENFYKTDRIMKVLW